MFESPAFVHAFFSGELFDPKIFDRLAPRWNRVFFPMRYGYGTRHVPLPRLSSPLQPRPSLIGHSGSTGSFSYCCSEKALYVAFNPREIARAFGRC